MGLKHIFSVEPKAELRRALIAANTGRASGQYTITLTDCITLTQSLPDISLANSTTLEVTGSSIKGRLPIRGSRSLQGM
jgi:hypothetical protein